MTIEPTVNRRRTIWYAADGNIHRDDNDLPAIINNDGSQEWWRHGLRHRDNDLPAIVKHTGHKAWFINGICHRNNDLPTEIYPDGTRIWIKNGNIHRDNDLPAIIKNNSLAWYQNNQLHREKGPARIYTQSGVIFWIIRDRFINPAVDKWIKKNKLSSYETWNETTWALFRLEFL